MDWEDRLKEGRQHTPVFLPEEFYGQRSLAGHTVHGVAKSQMQLSLMQKM